MNDMQDYFNNLFHANKILIDCLHAGQFHKEELNLMKCSCAFPSEIESGSLKLFNPVLNSKHSSKF